MNRKRLRRVALGFVAVAALLLLAAVLWPQPVLCIDSGEVRADALVVLGGGSLERPKRAAELFRVHAAPEIIVSGLGDCDTNKKFLVSNGVPAADIESEPNSRSTKENALFSIPLLRKLGAKRVILVTTWYHSRRALKCFRHYAPDLQFYSRPAYYGARGPERREVRGYVRAEYVKLAGYWLCYGICPL